MKPKRHFFLSVYGWTYWLPILLAGVLIMLPLAVAAMHDPVTGPYLWAVAAIVAILTFAGLAFFRDFPRAIPAEPDVMVAPADGKVTEITRIESYEPFQGPAWRVGIFLSVLDVHVNRAPCTAVVLSTQFKEGLFLDARHPESGMRNQSFTIVLGESPTSRPIAVVKAIVGAIARRILAPVSTGDVWQRGQRIGMIAFGSRTELYLPAAQWQITTQVNTHVKGGADIIARRTQPGH